MVERCERLLFRSLLIQMVSICGLQVAKDIQFVVIDLHKLAIVVLDGLIEELLSLRLVSPVTKHRKHALVEGLD